MTLGAEIAESVILFLKLPSLLASVRNFEFSDRP